MPRFTAERAASTFVDHNRALFAQQAEHAGYSNLYFSRLGEMRPRDAALLLLESCEREIAPSELGLADDAGHAILDALQSHPLLQRTGA